MPLTWHTHVVARDLVDQTPNCEAFNIGSGFVHSVMDMVKGFEVASARRIPLEVVGRREGDLSSFFADASKANRLLG